MMNLRLKATATVTAKPPGRLATATRRKARAVRPYLIAVAAVEVLALLAAALLHINVAVAALAGLCLGLGAAGQHAGTRAWETVDYRRSGGRRAARMRRKVQGLATWLELRSLSAGAARKHAKVTRPQTSGRLPITEAGVRLGNAGPLKRSVALSHEDAVLVIGPPRSGKSAALGNWIWDAPGACLVTSTRTDLYKNTTVPRRERGRTWTLNPGGYGGIPTDFAWSPLDGCETDQGARDAATDLMAAAPQDKAKDAYWTEGAADLLARYFHAAILGGYDIRHVQSWVANPSDAVDTALIVLDNHPMAAPGWGDTIADFLIDDGSEEKKSVQNSAMSALRWLSITAMSDVACAPPDQWFDVEEFIENGKDTIYLIGADKSLAPFFAVFAGRLRRAAKQIAETSPGGRLDPPLTYALDEAALICPVPLDEWSADSGGSGVRVYAAVQSPSQMKARWGEHGHDTIWNNMSKLIFGGLSLAADLRDISGSCGERDTWVHVKGESGKTRQPGKEPAVLPERIRKMAPGTALFVHKGIRPFFLHLKPVWDRKGYTPATVNPVTAPFVPLDGVATPGHLTDAALGQRAPINAVSAPTRALTIPIPAPRQALEEEAR